MGDFEAVSRLFLLLLGLAIAEVLKGFARVLRLKLKAEDAGPDGVRIGWLVPLLGTLTIVDQVTFWAGFQHAGRLLPGSFPSLVALVVVIGGYYALSTLIFPAEPRQWPDFDDYYFQVRRTVAGGILAVNIFSLVAVLALEQSQETGVFDGGADEATVLGALLSLLAIPALVALMFLRGRRASLAALVVANLLFLGEILPL